MSRILFNLVLILSIYFEFIFTESISNSTMKADVKIHQDPVNYIQLNLNRTNQTSLNKFNSAKESIKIKESKKSKNIDKILEMAQEEKANLCSYGENPQLNQICSISNDDQFPNYSPKYLKNLTLKAIESTMINLTIIKRLQEKCDLGEWCLPDLAMPMAVTKELTIMSNKNEKTLCLFSSCYSQVKNYIEKCVKSQISQDILHLGSNMCQFIKNKPLSNSFCPESTMRLIHLYISGINFNITQSNTCEDNIYKKQCSTECRKISNSLNKLEACCTNTDLLKSFKPFNWYFLDRNEVSQYCEMPLTSVCLSDGKYFVGISPNMLALSVILTVIFTTLFFILAYLICCRKINYYDQSDNKYYEYSKLNPNEEEDDETAHDIQMNLKDNNKNEIEYDMNNNENISRFVNQYQTDIKSLMT